MRSKQTLAKAGGTSEALSDAAYARQAAMAALAGHALPSAHLLDVPSTTPSVSSTSAATPFDVPLPSWSGQDALSSSSSPPGVSSSATPQRGDNAYRKSGLGFHVSGALGRARMTLSKPNSMAHSMAPSGAQTPAGARTPGRRTPSGEVRLGASITVQGMQTPGGRPQ